MNMTKLCIFFLNWYNYFLKIGEYSNLYGLCVILSFDCEYGANAIRNIFKSTQKVFHFKLRCPSYLAENMEAGQ